MNLQEIPKVASITKEAFIKDYYRPQKPVVLQGLVSDWPAYRKWDLEYIRKVAGEKEVPLYDNRPVSHKDGFNQAHARMRMDQYIDLLKKGPTHYRIFLWNLLKEVPELQQDFSYPDLGLPFLKSLPMLFFGGQDAYTFMHYDIDLGNIFHVHFEGKKECILFSQAETPYLYKVPHSLITHESIDFSDPDLDHWPALKHANGHRTTLQHGDVLYMPEGYWHYMRYLDPGFSMSLRALPLRPRNMGKALYNVVWMRYYDAMMRKLKGEEWIRWKNEEAIRRTHEHLQLVEKNGQLY
ncbi:cupin-like domain-containing protein [Zeaxanthinibacter sp. PT1]|uniref:cupin-like domain-containing protein n=1 Tax=Zeaxanthinibacter TaxID=561554 RepID=UPI00234AD117|nr:cupin-like domain-containing protein [Zeaxanthinibacter sp. PT1]MDC6351067.1 cupin-like domain-containing protein [Zeaxanthinibacter sp. PT1]